MSVQQPEYCVIYVTAVGCGLVIPVSTFVWAGVSDWPGYTSGRYGDSIRDGYRILLLLLGGYALTSPKGGGPCPLSTLNYGVTRHLAY